MHLGFSPEEAELAGEENAGAEFGAVTSVILERGPGGQLSADASRVANAIRATGILVRPHAKWSYGIYNGALRAAHKVVHALHVTNLVYRVMYVYRIARQLRPGGTYHVQKLVGRSVRWVPLPPHHGHHGHHGHPHHRMHRF